MKDLKHLIILTAVLSLAAAAAILASHNGGAAHAGITETQCSGKSGADACTVETRIRLIIIGIPTCPHCRAMKELLGRLAPGTLFCPVTVRGSVCAKAFAQLVVSGITRYVPTIVACDTSSGRIAFVEIGEYRNTTWWIQMLEEPPGRPYIDAGGERIGVLPGYLADRLSRMLCAGEAVSTGGPGLG